MTAIESIRAELAAATPGPWFQKEAWGPLTTWDGSTVNPLSHNNGPLVAHAPTYLAALLDEVERLRPVVEAARGFADHVANEDHGDADGECFGCGEAWPCFVERLHAALAALPQDHPNG